MDAGVIWPRAQCSLEDWLERRRENHMPREIGKETVLG